MSHRYGNRRCSHFGTNERKGSDGKHKFIVSSQKLVDH